MLEFALEYLKKMAAEEKTVLFVGTKPQVKKELKEAAQAVNMPYVVDKWMAGCLTNFPVVKKTIKKYNDLIEQRDTGKLKKYTKKEQSDFEKEIKKLEEKVGGLSKLNKIPDVVFIWDIKQERTALAEAKKRNVPVVAVCDTNVNPQDVNYVIPANDDATKTIKMICSLLRTAVEEGQKEKNK
jgi:small subunit ribosomal protein S2